ncbi:hypothetical protein [Parenemella sanctibonifatiensis]|uniref:Uncharacterized protein n=1 Tax=Parenemella sanctibonifatiensis TaxID=2016505 RepID=A0A255EN50_9ACTN|nr:hypothetical protein [Parenemella sanctibonifatiensis]OYN86529.1 hypothetical protein CGZ92_09320 [Parenemella sanctibonifatiensis]OYN91035.1 hypothetical protein CGZ91_06080 [Parenemella sanctibonifatiensis]
MRTFLTFALGAGVSLFIAFKAKEYLRKMTPDAVREQAAQKRDDLLGEAREMWRDLRSAMDEREAELREVLGLDEESDSAETQAYARRVQSDA